MIKDKSPRSSSILKICFCALFAALICICTFISVPLPFGYFNLGDIMILLCAWSLSPIYGAVAAAAGAGLADALMGFTLYIPATVVIKALMAICAHFTLVLIKKVFASPKTDIPARILSALCAEAIMVIGYFIYEYLLYGKGAVASIPGNLLQGICAITVASAFGNLFESRIGHKLFPKI